MIANQKIGSAGRSLVISLCGELVINRISDPPLNKWGIDFGIAADLLRLRYPIVGFQAGEVRRCILVRADLHRRTTTKCGEKNHRPECTYRYHFRLH